MIEFLIIFKKVLEQHISLLDEMEKRIEIWNFNTFLVGDIFIKTVKEKFLY